ncbi:Gfo/Idh/MocA family protein [Virgibacillus flavescens]|uniref:Gfo/Idh/MocA family protein n=1 Tax=Virgibacillus flavescens TaxID=1611422 RepID=UPI003D34732D
MKFAIVGCGRIAKRHIEAIINTKEAELYALCDNNRNRLDETAFVNNLKNNYEDIEEMLKDEKIDIVSICTPNASHAELAIKAIKAGKHVLLEKPIATTVEDAERIIQAAQDYHVKVTAVHQNRFNEAIQKTRKAYEDGRFGRMSHGVASIRWNRNKPYYDQDSWRGTANQQDGILMNQSIHNIDLLLWMMGPVKSVTGKTATRFRDIEMEDVGAAILEFESGALGMIEGAGTIYPSNLEETLNLFGDKGTVCIGGLAVNKIENWRFSDDFAAEEAKIISEQLQNPPTVYGYGHQLIVEDMIESIQKDREPYISLEDGKYAIEVILAIYESSRTGKSIKIRSKVAR